MTAVLETERLALFRLTPDDAPFIVELLNDPSFLRYIGDRGVRTPDAARRYIETGPTASYERFGFGLYRVALKATGEPIGICGLLKRDTLPDADVGFALLPRFRGRGYAFEAASAVLASAHEAHGLDRVLAITALDNDISITLLGKLGFRFERRTRLSDGAAELNVFARDV
jgi:RimJ/RimL family protein N-acetyltransferase